MISYTTKPTVLAQLADPYRFYGKNICLDPNGKLSTKEGPIVNFLGFETTENAEDLQKIKQCFQKKVNKSLDIAIATGTTVTSAQADIMSYNINYVAYNLKTRAANAGIPVGATFDKSFDALINKVGALAVKEEIVQQPKLTGLVRRLARYGLFKLYMGGGIGAYLSQTFPGAAEAMRAAMGEIGSYAAAALGLAADAAKDAAKGAAPVLKSNYPEILTFLAVTEGPGLVGYLARRAAPKPIQNLYKAITPSFIQKSLAWLCQTPKPVEKVLDKGLSVLEGVFN